MTEHEKSAAPAASTGQKERVGFSVARVSTIALNTFTEAVRQKVFNFLLLFALVAIASASFFSQFSFGQGMDLAREQLKFVKDFCLGALSVFGTLIAIVGTAQMLPSEVENRTIYTILSKPVRRFEFLLGKYMGSIVLIFMSVVMMSLMFGAALLFKENRLKAEVVRAMRDVPAAAADMSVATKEAHDMLKQIHADAIDPNIVKGVILIFMKLGLLAAITLFFSTFSTSMVFNVSVALMAFFAGNLRSAAAEMWGEHKIVMAILAVVPDLGAFNVADDIVLGNVIAWAHVNEVMLYGLARTVLIVVAAHVIFSKREI